MESNLKTRKELFEILKRFSNGTQTKGDFKKLINIIYYKTPYQNTIVFPSSKKDLKAGISNLSEGDLGATSERGKKIEIDIKNTPKLPYYIDGAPIPVNILALFITLGHEYTHRLQYMASIKNAQGKIQTSSEKFKSVLESIEGPALQCNLTDVFNLAPPKELKDQLNKYLYLQLPYEENARDCGFQFAKEMYEYMIKDELCDEALKNYLIYCRAILNICWKIEVEKRNSSNYLHARELYNEEIENIVKNNKDAHSTNYSTDSIILARMRKEQVDKQTYFEYMISHYIKPDKLDHAYLDNEDLKELLKNAIYTQKIYGGYLFKNSFGIKFNPAEVTEICTQAINSDNAKVAFSILMDLKIRKDRNKTKSISLNNEEKAYLKLLKNEKIEKTVLDQLNTSLETLQTLLKSGEAQKQDEKFLNFGSLLSLLEIINHNEYQVVYESIPKNIYNACLDAYNRSIVESPTKHQDAEIE